MPRGFFQGVVIFLLSLGIRGLLMAQEEQFPAEDETTILQGEVIDPALYLREGRHGPEAEDLIYDAVDGGQTLAVLEAGTDTIYLLLAEEPGEDPNELLYEDVGRRVKVTGLVYERGGLKGIVVTSVEPLEATAIQPSENVGLE